MNDVRNTTGLTVREYVQLMQNYNPPFLYDAIDNYISRFQPATIRTVDSATFCYFFNGCLQELYHLFQFDGLPEDWNEQYFVYNLILRGFVGMVNARPYGWIPQPCTWGGERNVFAFPLSIIVVNGWFHPDDNRLEYKLGKDAYLINCTPNFSPIADIAFNYAKRLATLWASLDNSAFLSRSGYLIATDTKAKSLTLTDALKSIMNGDLIVSLKVPKDRETGTLADLNIIESDVRKHYICGQIIADMLSLLDMFHAEIGFPVINRAKKERTITAEQESQNASVTIKSDLWFEELTKSLDAFNRATGYNITVSRTVEKLGVLEDMIGEEETANAD